MNEESRTDALDDTDLAALLRRGRTRGQAVAARRWPPCAPRSRRNGARRWPRGSAADSSPAGRPRPAWRWPPSRVWLAQPACAPAEPQSWHRSTRVVGDVQQNRGDGRWIPLDARGPDRGRHAAAHRQRRPCRAAAGRRRRTAPRLAHAASPSRTLRTRRLAKGAVYVDSRAPGRRDVGRTSSSRRPPARVRHLGTQYEARLAGDGLRVGVREGRVQVGTPTGAVQGCAGRAADPSAAVGRACRAGARLPRTGTGSRPSRRRSRSRAATSRTSWCGPAARPAGPSSSRRRDAAQQARSVILSGTVEGLTPDEARGGGAVHDLAAGRRSSADRIRVEAAAP